MKQEHLFTLVASMMISGAQMVRQIQTAVFDESCNVFMPLYRQISMPKPGSDYRAIIDYGFFFNNLKQNVADRIKAFLEKQ